VIEIEDTELAKLVEGVTFYSITYRLFKTQEQEDREEDFGQTATYLGTINDSKDSYQLDEASICALLCVQHNTLTCLRAQSYPKVNLCRSAVMSQIFLVTLGLRLISKLLAIVVIIMAYLSQPLNLTPVRLVIVQKHVIPANHQLVAVAVVPVNSEIHS
jgi:hypothetical protein